jgi:hypothetical protein
VAGGRVEPGQGRGEHPELVGDGSQWSDGVTPGPDPATFMRVHEVVDDRSLLGSFAWAASNASPPPARASQDEGGIWSSHRR